jgi:large conductance mechanosensitive channel
MNFLEGAVESRSTRNSSGRVQPPEAPRRGRRLGNTRPRGFRRARVARPDAGKASKATGENASMSFAKEFKEFALKGNVMDLAVGVIIGAAFGKIVDSLVKDVIMPVVGRIFGGLDFSNYFVLLAQPPAGYSGPMTYDALTKAGVPLFAYGNFLTVAINFIILAFIIFLMIRQVNRLKKNEPPPAAVATEEILLLRDIRDSVRR